MFNILYYLLTFSPEVVSEWKKDSSSAVWQKHVRDFVIKIQIIDQDGSLISFCRIINKLKILPVILSSHFFSIMF